jgi:hypothetical protein
MGLWTTLFLASTWSIKLLLVRGDSKVIIDWITLKSNLHTVQIECWKQRTLELAKNFTTLNVQHFPRAFNREADALSKRALIEVTAGKLTISHCDEGIESPPSILDIF